MAFSSRSPVSNGSWKSWSAEHFGDDIRFEIIAQDAFGAGRFDGMLCGVGARLPASAR
ncbi:hypothetical protein [Rhodococcus opacus]|uniref:hypothetical protein n=1 Tax=Rhodococcus opacus TaxID=37919 RepID=UPI0034D38EAF